ncbi:MAG: hypothetical protein LBH95_09385 [Oscillospiraceae bacterium]|jgi:DNA-directed RNA polymerase subunit RPC12/RpoP|nr:hypothetical protein [Oscillospiraceae bacterium]
MPTTLKCTNCGGELKFSPELQKWKCEWCDKEHTEADLREFSGASADGGTGDAGTVRGASAASVRREETDGGVTVTYRCGYCGAEVVTAEETSATFCVYCQRPVTITSQVSGEFRPSAVLPFKNTKDKALEQFRGFLKGKRFLPDSFIADQNIEKLTGVYIPFWLFDGALRFDVEGEGDIVSTSRQGDYQVTKTDTYKIVRRGRLGFRNVPADASSKTPDDVMDSIEPFDFSGLKPFATPYLSGFLAERWDVPEGESFRRAEKRFIGSAEKRINASLSRYRSVRRQRDEKRAEGVAARYGLLPVWLLYTSYGGKTYLYAMNGQTDKILGDLPVDRGKMFRFGALVFGISGTLCGLLGLALTLAGVF